VAERPWRGSAEPDDLAAVFQRFAADAGEGYSPAYELLASRVAGDRDLLALAALTPPGRPAANMLLAAARFLAFDEPRSPLARAYEALATRRAFDPELLWTTFRDFCLERRTAIEVVLATRRVQTNEPGRAALLLPALTHVAAAAGRPLALVEIGTSAGLLLRFDRYAIRYVRDGASVLERTGDAPLIECTLRGALVPPVPADRLDIASRVGIDLAPIDPRDAGSRRWLEALVWPDQPRRLERLRAALDAAAADPPAVVAGDALDLLPGMLAAMPARVAPVVFHAWVLNQFTAAARQQLDAILATAAQHRRAPVYRVAMESTGVRASTLSVITVGGEAPEEVDLGVAQSHGTWLEWREG